MIEITFVVFVGVPNQIYPAGWLCTGIHFAPDVGLLGRNLQNRHVLKCLDPNDEAGGQEAAPSRRAKAKAPKEARVVRRRMMRKGSQIVQKRMDAIHRQY